MSKVLIVNVFIANKCGQLVTSYSLKITKSKLPKYATYEYICLYVGYGCEKYGKLLAAVVDDDDYNKYKSVEDIDKTIGIYVSMDYECGGDKTNAELDSELEDLYNVFDVDPQALYESDMITIDVHHYTGKKHVSVVRRYIDSSKMKYNTKLLGLMKREFKNKKYYVELDDDSITVDYIKWMNLYEVYPIVYVTQ